MNYLVAGYALLLPWYAFILRGYMRAPEFDRCITGMLMSNNDSSFIN